MKLIFFFPFCLGYVQMSFLYVEPWEGRWVSRGYRHPAYPDFREINTVYGVLS